MALSMHKYNLKRSPIDSRDLLHPVCAVKPVTLPKLVDLRSEMPTVLDQGSLGSCASNAASNCMRHLLKKESKPEFQPSRLYLYWNTRVNIEKSPPGEDTGVCIRDICKSLSKYHACDEKIWPYIIEKFSEAPPLEAYKNANTHGKITYASVPQNLQKLKQVLANKLPIIIGIQVFESFESEEVAKSGVVPMPGSKEKCLGGHAVLMVGYDDSKKSFIVMNSWGSDWGQKGFFELPYDYVSSPDLASDFWVLSYFA